MKKIFSILLFLIISIACFSQSIVPRTNSSFTVMDSRFKAQYNLFVPAYADTTAANLQKGIDSLGAVIFTYNTMTLWVRSQSPKVWTEVGSGSGGSGTVTNVATGYGLTGGPITTTGTIIFDSATVFPQLRATITASEGLHKDGNDIRLGTPFGSATPLTENRVVDLGERQLHFAKDYVPLVSDTTNSHFRLTVIDTIYANTLPSSIVKTTATSLNRIYRVTGNFASQFKVGHGATTLYQFGDTARVLSNGGDFGGNFYSSLNIGYLPSFTTGRSAIQGGVVDFEAIYSGISDVTFSSSNASRHTRYRGWLSAKHSYLRMINQPDTIDNFIFYQALGFKEAAAKVLKAYNFYPNFSDADSSWSWYSKLPTNNFYQEGSMTIGGGYTSSPYKLRVEGDSYFSDSVYVNTAREVTDTTGYDVVLRKRTDGTLLRIRADLLEVGGGSSLFPTTGTGTATGAVVGSLDGNTLTVNHGGNEFFHIDPTAGDEHAHLQAYNGTDLDNISTFTANTNNTSAIALFSASFNGSNKAADISALANATKSTLVYSADSNTINGAVVLSDLAGNGVGIVAVNNDGFLSFTTALSNPMTTLNDLIAGDVSGGAIRVPAGTAGQFLRINGAGTALEYATISGGGDALTSSPLSQFAATTSAQLAGVISNETGTGVLVFDTSPLFTTPRLASTSTIGYVWTATDASGNGSFQAAAGVPALTQYRLAVGDASNLMSTGAAITGDRALISDVNGVPTHSATTATELGYVNGVTSPIQTQLTNKTFVLNVLSLISTTINDAVTQYMGNFPAVWQTGATTYEITIDKSCTLIGATVESQCSTAGTDEDWTTYVRVNNTTDYTIATVAASTNRRTWTNSSINTTGVSLVAGDKVIVKFINPTWATNPGNCINSGYLRFREN